MRFLLIVPYTYPDYSGSGINALNYARHLIGEGHDATLLTFNRKGKQKSRETRGNVPIRRILYFNNNKFTKFLSLFLIIPSYIVSIVKNDIVLIYGGHVIAFELAILMGRLFGKKVVFQSLLVGADDLTTLLNKGTRLLTSIRKFSMKRISLYHAINPEFTTLCPLVLKDRFRMLEAVQGVDIKIFSPGAGNETGRIRNEFGIGADEFLMVSVGFLIPRKGFGELFRVLSGLQFQFRLMVIGEYRFGDSHFLSGFREEAQNIIELGKELLGNEVIFTGPVDNMASYFRSADVFVLNSSQEGTPNSLLEAMASGLPVVIRQLNGLEGFLVANEKNGFIYHEDGRLLDILEQLYNDPELRETTGRSARMTIEQKATFSRVTDACLELLETTGTSSG